MTRNQQGDEDNKRFKTLLLAKRNEILKNVSELRDEALHLNIDEGPRFPSHPADVGTDYYDLENTIGLLESERQILRDIDRAVECLEQGIYGYCEACQNQIPVKRLEAIPWARYCVACADVLEKNEPSPKPRRLPMRKMPY